MSLRAKLFIMTILITSISLGSVIVLEVNYIKKILTGYYNARLFEESKSIARSIDQNIELALSQHSGAFTMLLNASDENRATAAKRYVATNSNISHLGIILKNLESGTPKISKIVDTENLYDKISSKIDFSDSSQNIRKLMVKKSLS